MPKGYFFAVLETSFSLIKTALDVPERRKYLPEEIVVGAGSRNISGSRAGIMRSGSFIFVTGRIVPDDGNNGSGTGGGGRGDRFLALDTGAAARLVGVVAGHGGGRLLSGL